MNIAEWALKVKIGDYVASRRNGTAVSGRVLESAPEIGVVWIRESVLGERRMLLMSGLVPEAPQPGH